MKLLFGSGDVGGARALLPIMDLAHQQEVEFAYLAHGHIVKEARESWPALSLQEDLTVDVAMRLLAVWQPKAYIFASSVSSKVALIFAHASKRKGIPVIHVLDHWTNYAERLLLPGMPQLLPNIYTVMDQVAYDEAVTAGIPEKMLRITGQPALALPQEAIRAQMHANGEAKLIFVSEPVLQDQGMSRGYTEKEVLALVARSLQPLAGRISMELLPHPREDAGRLAEHWNLLRGELKGGVVRLQRGRDALQGARAVIGMASILLYESWLLGLPVASVQPGLKTKALHMIARQEEVFFADTIEKVSGLKSWVMQVMSAKPSGPRPELSHHRAASERILALAYGLTNYGLTVGRD